MPESHEREKELFGAALELATPEERRAFVAAACGNDEFLRKTVEGLLEAHAEAEGFIPQRVSEAASAACPVVDEKLGTIVGRYKLLEKIGEGGMGVVFMAEQEDPVRRKVALKIIKLGMDTKQVVARFEAERQALALMEHPNIAKVLDGGATENGRPFFVMELVQGVPITEFCEKNQLTAEERVKLLIPVCQAIQSAHQKGIIHRDLKPSNILVTLNAGTPYPMVIDFGVAKAVNQKLTDKTLFTNFATMIGTPAYMSPEQAEMSRLDVDTRADIYGLGVLLYELLTGTTPFPEKRLRSVSYNEMQRIIMEEEPERPSTRLRQTRTLTKSPATVSTEHPSLSTDLDWIIMKCLEKDRARRYETANGLAADLKRHLENEPVMARPPSNLYRFQKTVRRNKLAIAAVGAVAVMLILGIIASSLEARRAWRAEQQQSHLRSEADAARNLAQAQAHRAEAATAQVRTTLEASYFAEARRLLAGGAGDPPAVAYLSRILVMNPSNHVALSQLAMLLTYHSWSVPVLSFTNVYYAAFLPDGESIITVGKEDSDMRLWDARTGQPVTPPVKLGGSLDCAQLSPDGKWLAASLDNGAMRVWDIRQGQPLTPPMKHEKAILSIRFSPDGKRIVSVSEVGNASLWDAQTGQPLTEPLRQDQVRYAEFSPDGERALTASRDYTARIWNARTGQTLCKSMQHGLWVWAAHFSSDGRRIVTASGDFRAHIWDAYTGEPIGQPMTCQNTVRDARFSPDGKRIVTASADHTGRVWDAETGQPVTSPLKHQNRVIAACFSPDGNRVVTASEDYTARVWDAQRGQCLAVLTHGSIVSAAEFSPDGRRILTETQDGVARIWDAPMERAVPQTFGLGVRAQFSPDGQNIVTAWGNTVRVWHIDTGRPITSPLQLDDTVYDAEFSPDGLRIATASAGGTAQIWNAQTGQPLTPPMRHKERVYSANFSPDGKRIVTASWDKTAQVWDAQTGERLTPPLRHDDKLIGGARFSPDGALVVTTSLDGAIVVWDSHTGQRLAPGLHQATDAIYAAMFDSAGHRMVTHSSDHTARVWDVRTGKPLTDPMRHGGTVTYAEFSPDGKRIVTSSADETARVWDAQTGQPLTEPMKHKGWVQFARFSPEGARVVTTVPLTVHDWISDDQFSPGGKRVLSASSAAQLWDAATGLPLTEPLQFTIGSLSPASQDSGTEVPLQDDSVRLWDVGFVPTNPPAWLLSVAEAISGVRLNEHGMVEETRLDRAQTIARIRQDLNDRQDTEDGVRWGRWLVSDPANRTISPESTITVSNYIEERIKDNTLDSLNEAEQLALGNAILLGRVLDLRDQALHTTKTTK